MILKGLKGQIPSSAVDGELVVAVDWRGALVAWQLWNATPLRTVAKAHAGRANAVVLGATWVATTGWDGAVRLWDRETFAPLGEWVMPDEIPHGGIWKLSLHDDVLDACLDVDQAWRFPLVDGVPSLSAATYVESTERRAGLHVRVRYGAQNATTFTVCEGDTVRTTIELGVQANEPVLSHDGTRLWAVVYGTRDFSGGNTTLREYAIDGALLRDVALPTQDGCRTLLYGLSPDGTLLLGATIDRLRLWDVATLAELVPEDWRHTQLISGAHFTDGGEGIVSAGWDATLRQWDLREILAARPAAPAVAPAVEAPKPAANKDDAHAEAPAPEGVTDGDALYDLGYYRAAIAAYASAPAHTPDEIAGRCIDRAACHLKLGEEMDAWNLRCEAGNARHHSGSEFNHYAWAQLQAGHVKKALRLVETAMEWRLDRAEFRNLGDTWARCLDVLGPRETFLVALDALDAMYGAHGDTNDLLDRERAAVDAYAAQEPTDATRALVARVFAYASYGWSAVNAYGLTLLRRSSAWAPTVVEGLALAPMDWQPRDLYAGLDETHGRVALSSRLQRWADVRIREEGGKVALRELFRATIEDGVISAAHAKALRSANGRKRHRFRDCFDGFASAPVLVERLSFLVDALG